MQQEISTVIFVTSTPGVETDALQGDDTIRNT